MNPGLVVKLRPTGPWRIGPDSGARNRVDVVYHSDALYSAVTGAMLQLGALEAWLEATARAARPAVSFTSCFPFLDELRFVIPPRTIWPPNAGARVRWKSARFIPLNVVQKLFAGKNLHDDQWTVDGTSECLLPSGRPGPFRTSIRQSAAVDRVTGASERHSTACLEFRPGAGLWTAVSFADRAANKEWGERVRAAFRLLADTGFGGERSRGWGRSEAPEFIEGSLPDMILPPMRKPARPPQPPPTEVVEPVAPVAEITVEPELAVEPEAEALPGAAPLPEVVEAAAEPEIESGSAEVKAPREIEPFSAAADPDDEVPADAPDATTTPIEAEIEKVPPAEAASETPPVETVPEVPAAEVATEPESVPELEPVPVEPEPEPVFAAKPPSKATQAFWLLSLYTPGPADLVDWTIGNYAVLSRGGRIESQAASGGLKKQINMVAEGSVLFAEAPFSGSAPDVAPDGFPHPVYRSGFAVAIPLPGEVS